MPKIQGRIIRILDKRTVIINLGREHGINDSSIFHILGEPEAIIDRFSEEELGKISIVKSKLKAEGVYDKFTIATTKWTYITNPYLSLSALIDPISKQNETHVVDEGELKVPPGDIEPWKAKSENSVRVGDYVEVEISLPRPKPIDVNGEKPAPPTEVATDSDGNDTTLTNS